MLSLKLIGESVSKEVVIDEGIYRSLHALCKLPQDVHEFEIEKSCLEAIVEVYKMITKDPRLDDSMVMEVMVLLEAIQDIHEDVKVSVNFSLGGDING